MTPELRMMGGLRLVADATLVESVEDWSGVRSPSRAARRRRLGHPQRIVCRLVPKREVFFVDDMIVGHPETIARIAAAADVTVAFGLPEVRP